MLIRNTPLDLGLFRALPRSIPTCIPQCLHSRSKVKLERRTFIMGIQSPKSRDQVILMPNIPQKGRITKGPHRGAVL